MDHLVCPDDEEQLKVVDPRWGERARPLVRCPACGRHFVLGGWLEPVDPPG